MVQVPARYVQGLTVAERDDGATAAAGIGIFLGGLAVLGGGAFAIFMASQPSHF